MCRVSSLKSLSLRVVADLLWDVLKTESKSLSLERTLEIKLTNLINGLDDYNFYVPFLNCIKNIASAFQNVFNTDLLMNSLWNNFTMKPANFETTLHQVNEYLSLPTSVKLELSRVLSTQSNNLFQMALMIEMGFPCLDFQHYLKLDENLTFRNLLKLGKKSIKKLILSKPKWMDNRFTSFQSQKFLITSFPYLRELTANGTCCNDYTLRLVAIYCEHLKKLDVGFAQGVTDRGIEFLCSPKSAAKQLMHLELYFTKVTAKGAEKAMKHLTRLECLNCYEMNTVSLLKSLAEQELVFVGYKEISIIFIEETQEIYKCEDVIRKLPLIFPNLRNIRITIEVFIEPECLLVLRSLSKIEKLQLLLHYMNASWGLFPCENYRTNFLVQMHNLTELSLYDTENVCIHSVLESTPSLRYLTIEDVFDSRCIHTQAVITYPSVLHLALLRNIGEAVVEKCMSLCPSVETLALIPDDEMQFSITSLNLTNLTHLSLDCLQMETAAYLVENCKNLQVLNLTKQLPESEEAAWFQRHSPFVKVMHCNTVYKANWFEDETFSP